MCYKCLAAIVVVAGLAGAFGMQVSGQKPEAEPKVHDLMVKKLQNSQKVLEGIALNDPELIAKHARELIEISKQAEWRVFKTPRYELWSNEFRRNAETMADAAKVKNLEGATLAYVDLTLTCVKCHKYVREERRVELPAEQELIRFAAR
jgi:hypothetical protein